MATRAGAPAAPSADAALRILTHLARNGPTAASSLAHHLGLARSTTYQLLGTLSEHGFVTHLIGERAYGLGLRALEVGTAYSRQAPLARIARPILTRMVDQHGESAHVAVLQGRQVLYVVEARAPRRPALVTDVGIQLPAELTASGRAILAGLPAQQLRALYPAPSSLVLREGGGPHTLAELRAILARARRDGWAREDGDVTPGFGSVAAAVTDRGGAPVAAVTFTFPLADVDDDRRLTLARAAVGTASAIALRLRGM